MKNIIIITIIAISLLFGGAWWSNDIKEKNIAQEIEGIEQYTRTDRSHVDGDITYEKTPSVGGNHANVWAACNGNVYNEPVIEEQAVHSMEHGAVWITYKSSLEAEQIDKLKNKVRGYTFMSPLDEQDAPIILTAWGVQLLVESAEDPRVDQFVKKFRQGPQTLEPGATCNAVPGGMS